MNKTKLISEFISDDPDSVFAVMKKSRHSAQIFTDNGDASFPFHEEMLGILKRANPLEQKYYFIEDEERYAFFTSYMNRMNLFTFGRAEWYIRLQTIAFPCSLSCSGFLTNDTGWMLGYIKTIKGCKLVLNLEENIRVKGMASGETLPTCSLTLKKEHTSVEAYLDSLRSPYRRRMNLAMKRCADIRVIRNADESINVHPLYLQTYERSDYKLECLGREFFDKSEGEKLVFMRGDEPAGFVLLKVNGEELIFMLCGMEYKEGENNADLYYFMLLHIVGYAIEHDCRTIDFGQTSENTKLKFGAVLKKRYFYAHHSVHLINLLAILGRHLLEYDKQFGEYHVFR